MYQIKISNGVTAAGLKEEGRTPRRDKEFRAAGTRHGQLKIPSLDISTF
jgi:hypothetical protein